MAGRTRAEAGTAGVRVPCDAAGPVLRREPMCLNCGCMAAHDDMGKPNVNITYEDIKRAADGNQMTVKATLAMIARTAEKDRHDHPTEYPAKKSASAPYAPLLHNRHELLIVLAGCATFPRRGHAPTAVART